MKMNVLPCDIVRFSTVFDKMQKQTKRFNLILRKSKKLGLSFKDLSALDVGENINKINSNSRKVGVVFLSCLALTLVFLLHDSKVPMSWNIFRKPEDCSMCENVNVVDKVENIEPGHFERHYAATKKPLVILDGTKGWLAAEKFDFEFFKKLYKNTTSHDSEPECQFFPYKTEFKSLREALDMDYERSRLSPGTLPWYIGWSNCNNEAGKILKNYYDRPYFLPKSSENIALNWIFMGGPGFGAHMHVDNVRYPSWQAQLKGRKLWKLVPPPECLYKCQELQVTVNRGEIIVVDTNSWYHQTFILPGEISVTIGSEFD